MIDLRSDTVTKPTPAMLAAMQSAIVGDDVYSEDPTINELERYAADYFGKEACLFVPSGTMSNQIAIRLHCKPGDEMICDHQSHVLLWEAGGPAALSGVTTRMITGQNGILSADLLDGKIRPKDMHSPQTRLVVLENTHNRGGGTCYELENIMEIEKWARTNGLAMHMDGARIWNALIAKRGNPTEWAKPFDTLSVCFSKGLGAPVGSALIGPKDIIDRGRWVRKLFGGAMRQAGYLAAASLFAMKNHISRLADDHANAQLLAEAVTQVPAFRLVPEVVETNLVWFEVDAAKGGRTAQDVVAILKAKGVLMSALGRNVVRACTHLNVSREECQKAAAEIRAFGK
jgi:threonine aldolase